MALSWLQVLFVMCCLQWVNWWVGLAMAAFKVCAVAVGISAAAEIRTLLSVWIGLVWVECVHLRVGLVVAAYIMEDAVQQHPKINKK